ncbi:zinc-ribbon domain containing protein [Accumulibacter sp.]|uniref:zinc-ribbon domain containing protein n=1 Tax=Accumulibacter sp. TaxID=2053492 RepID=UPI0026206E18|nr:zinc-ribbon domain containing protein [Accumulibacter sp.]
MMRSGKQKREALRVRRRRRQQRQEDRRRQTGRPALPARTVPVSPERLAELPWPGAPDFIRRGYYEDLPFVCVDCGAACIWFAQRQKWWYEVADGDLASTARRCAACRARARERRRLARQQTFAGRERRREQQQSEARSRREAATGAEPR